MSRTREEQSTKKTSKVQRTSLPTHPNAPLPKDVKVVNPTPKVVKYQQPKKPEGKSKVPLYVQPSKKKSKKK